MRVRLYSHLPLSECQQRLEAATDRYTWSSNYRMPSITEKPVIASIKDSHLLLFKRRRFSNTFAPYLFGNLMDNGKETVLQGRFGMTWFAIVFLSIWLCGALYGSGMLLILSIQFSLSSGTFFWPGVIGTLFVIALGIGFMLWNRKLHKNEWPFLLEFLKQTLEAEEIPSLK